MKDLLFLSMALFFFEGFSTVSFDFSLFPPLRRWTTEDGAVGFQKLSAPTGVSGWHHQPAALQRWCFGLFWGVCDFWRFVIVWHFLYLCFMFSYMFHV